MLCRNITRRLGPAMTIHHGATRNASQHQTPRISSPEAKVYVLTLHTDKAHHETMTRMRKQYFPPKLNHLEAHITMFHALPGSRLVDAIEPTLRDLCATTAPFDLAAVKPFRLSKGIAIAVPDNAGGSEAKQLHASLRDAWKPFLSAQDDSKLAAHYTIMNKVHEEEEVQRAFEEVRKEWQPCQGRALGMSLFLYKRGKWIHSRDYDFALSTK